METMPIGQLQNTFPVVKDVSLESADRERKLDRTQITQQTLIQGNNKVIILNDGANDRIIIGYLQGAF